MFEKMKEERRTDRILGNRTIHGGEMSSSKYGLYSPINLLVLSILSAFVVIVFLVFFSPMVLRNYEFALKANPLEYSSADFHEEFGYWEKSRQALYVSFILPPITGFVLAMAFRRYIKNLLLKNQHLFKKEIRRRLMRWDGIGLKKLRGEISISPRFLPLFIAIIFLIVLDQSVFLVGSSTLAFMATCGFISYGTWQRIYTDAMSLESAD